MVEQLSTAMAVLQICLAFLKLYLLAAITIIVDFLRKHRRFKDTEPRHGKLVAIVTGGASGIGLSVSRQLACRGLHIIIAARDEQEAKTAKQDIARDAPHAIVDFIHLDLASLSSVRTFVSQFEDMRLPLHLLINNAGVMIPPNTITEEGFELQFAVNYLGPFLLTQLLLGKLKESGSSDLYARVVNVSSVAHFPGRINFDNLNAEQYYSSHAAYSQSKLAVVVSTYKLQQQLQGEGAYVTANCLNPGVVNTNLYRHMVVMPDWLKKYVLKIVLKTADQGADTVLYTALAAELEGRGGLYLDNCTEVPSKAVSYDVDLQDRLWCKTMELVKLQDNLST